MRKLKPILMLMRPLMPMPLLPGHGANASKRSMWLDYSYAHSPRRCCTDDKQGRRQNRIGKEKVKSRQGRDTSMVMRNGTQFRTHALALSHAQQ